MAAVLTPANVADGEPAPDLLRKVPAEVRFVLGNLHYNTPDLCEQCEQADRLLVSTHYGRYLHTDEGVEVRRVFHKLRSIAMENFNEHFKGIFDGHGQVPTKGSLSTQRFALGAIFVYQLAVLYRFEHDLELCVGLKVFSLSVDLCHDCDKQLDTCDTFVRSGWYGTLESSYIRRWYACERRFPDPPLLSN